MAAAATAGATAPVRVEVCDGVGHLVLARPSASNAVDLPTAHALRDAVGALAADDAVAAVLVTGEGPRFCAGGDVASMLAATDRAAYLEELAAAVDEALVALHRLEKPVVAAVKGAVAGAGLAVMLSCDLVVAQASTRFVSAYAGVGLTPDCGLSWLLPRAVGQQRALELLLTPRVLTVEEARDWGMVTEVVPDGDADRAAELAERLARGPAYALGQARRLVRSGWDADRAAVGRDEAATIARAVTTPQAAALLDRFAGR
ncbi:enoyl-CoA hydratase/isomerase family protein [Nocardioides sp. IC4_145]|uniref:enoyl-CoA hydratase/isomerase family protein n=1 Tax=Nocardioides sp. IC4_145 TaxID=2714037 RepID=UPI00140C6C02|nr:enoyl-CoA hydratase/isomerase family protein [Nocardioides sp. IC4_145]NHC21912.1 enoyl-CoA hydratase/isomerase family protein [Nocardioides sp. IC4_145]